MNTILVVDDLKIFRDLVAAVLRHAGYHVVVSGNAAEAAIAVQQNLPDLILLDIAMPGMDGIQYLEQLRRKGKTADVPVILLTATSDKKKVRRASQLRVRDYLIKSEFSLEELLARVRKNLPPRVEVMAGLAFPGTAATQSSEAAPVIAAREGNPQQNPQRLSREDATLRAVKAAPAHALSGVVSQVIELTASPNGDVSQLGEIVARDASLSARILRAANSPTYATLRGAVTNLNDAIRNIGRDVVREVAVSLAIFDAIPQNAPDGFNSLYCREHSLAVARLCEQLCSLIYRQEASAAYLVGLCHDLGELVFREQFGAEHRAVVEAQRRDGRPLSAVEKEWFGMPRGELVGIILRHLGLPAAIREPISQFHMGPSATDSPLARILRLAEAYANGLNLAASPGATIMSFTKVQCRNTTGVDDPPAPDTQSFVSEVVAMTCLLAKMDVNDESGLSAPIYAKGAVRIWLARDPLLSTFDPIWVFLNSLGDVVLNERLPEVDELDGIDALVVTASTDTVSGLGSGHVLELWTQVKTRNLPILWLIGSGEPSPSPDGAPTPIHWPICLNDVATFVRGLEPARIAA